jgi:hypothetical protein
MVNIRVGKGRNTEVFAIHKHKLCHDSSYFQVALNDELPVEELFVELAIQHLDFDKISPQVFRLFFRGCYSQSIKDENTRKFPDYTIIIQLWVLGGIIMFPDVQNIAIKSLCALKEYPRSKDLKYIYDRTVPQSGSRDWAIDSLARLSPAKFLRQLMEEERGMHKIVSQFVRVLCYFADMVRQIKFLNKCLYT